MQFWQSDKNFSCPITVNDPKKSPKKMQKLFEKFFVKLFPWRARKQLESPADFFRTASRNNSARNSRKRSICRFCKRLAPESLHWNWESSFDNSATFFARFGQKKCSVSKNEKKKQNCSSLKCYLGHVECSLNIPVEKLEKKPETSS